MPKPLVPVGDAAALAHLLARIKHVRPLRCVVNTHYYADLFAAWLNTRVNPATASDAAPNNVTHDESMGEPEPSVTLCHEPALLGTAGAIANAARFFAPDVDVLVWNGDILSSVDPRALLAAHAARRTRRDSPGTLALVEPLATLAVRGLRKPHEGNVGLGAKGRVVRLRDVSVALGATDSLADTREVQSADFVGIHVIAPALWSRMPALGCLVGDVYIPAIVRGDAIYAHVVDAAFVDIGSIGSYAHANAEWLAQRGLSQWAHPSADVRTSIEGSCVGAGAVVLAPATSSVVWPHARVVEPCHRAIVTPLRIVQL